MRFRCNRKIERSAVNAARTLFESCDCVFQEVELANDYGKDAYVDIAEAEDVTGLCVALQIKGGKSYRRSNGYGIPLDQAHARIWETSSVPVAGIVFDPDDETLRWCNISEFLGGAGAALPSYIPIAAAQILTPETLEKQFKPSFRSFQTERTAGPALLQLTSAEESTRASALLDCFAVGRSEPRVLVLLRYLLGMFKDNSLELAITILAHTTPHPDILWREGNWVLDRVCKVVTAHFRWTHDEIECLLRSVPWEEWQRGGLGEHLYCILREDPEIERKMGEVALSAMSKGNDGVAFSAMYLTI